MSEIVVGTSYYGTVPLAHALLVRELRRQTIPVIEVRGCPYPELARAEIVRGLYHEDRVLVFVDPDVVVDPGLVKALADKAHAIGGVALGTIASKNFPVLELPPDTETVKPLGFAAVSLPAIKKLAELEDRSYTNSCIKSAKDMPPAKPFFSPWKKSEGVSVAPLCSSYYSTPDMAFLVRCAKAQIPIEALGTNFCYQGSKRAETLVVRKGDKSQRDAHSFKHDYAICIPSFGGLDWNQQRDVDNLEKAGLTILELNGCPYLDLARSILIAKARELGKAGVFFIDHDIIFQPKDIIGLIEEAESRQDVVSAIYSMRTTAHSLIGAPDVPIDSEVGFFGVGAVYPALYSGLGFSAIPMRVFEELDNHMPLVRAGIHKVRPYFGLDCNGNFYSGEDVSFCARVQGLTVRHIPGVESPSTPDGIDWDIKRNANGFTRRNVWIDTRVRIYHKGEYLYGVEDHSVAVPRFEKFKGVLVATRAEARSVLLDASKFSPETRARAIGVDLETEHGHGILEEEKPETIGGEL